MRRTTNERMRAMRWPILLCIPLVFILAAAKCGRPKPDPSPKPEEPPSKIVVEDMHAASWMVVDNDLFVFLEDTSAESAQAREDGASEGDHDHPGEPADGGGHPAGPRSLCAVSGPKEFGACAGRYVNEATASPQDPAYRHGVLVQMGVNRACTFGGVTDTSYLEDLLIRHETDDGSVEEVELEPEQFDWVDVLPEGAKCVIDPLHAYSMFQNMLVKTDCDAGDDPIDCGAGYDTDFACRRRRSLHASVLAQRILTYWSGPAYYDVVVDETEEVPADTATHTLPKHVSYTIRPTETLTADVWKDGCWQQRYDNVVEIRVRFHDPDATHLGFDHLPIDGGNIGPRP